MSVSENSNITQRAGLVGLLTLASRILGLVRDTLIAHLFGAGHTTDAFYMAFTIPNTFRQLVAEGSLTIAFLPVFSEVRHKEGEQASRDLVRDALGVFPLLVALLVAGGMLAAHPLTMLFAKGFVQVPGKFELTVSMTRWLFPYLWCAAMVALAMGILNAIKRFVEPAVAPALFNASIIAVAAGWYYLHEPSIYAVVAGVLAGGVAQVILQVWGLKRAGLLGLPRLRLSPPMKRILYLMLPALLGTSIYELNILVTRYIVSFLEEGSLSYLYNADRFSQLPLGVFGFAIATAALPSLADHAAAGDRDQFKRTLSFAYRFSNYIIIPASVALVLLALPIVAVVFQHGAFTARMAEHTASALVFYVIGLGAVALVRQTVQAFFALQDTRTPVACAAVGLAINFTCAMVLVEHLSFRALALSLGCASWGQLLLLQIFLFRRIGLIRWAELLLSGAKAMAGTLLMGVTVWGMAHLGVWEQGTTLRNAAVLGGTVLAGMGVYFAVTAWLRSDEFAQLKGALMCRLRRV